ncbi:MAG TPA: hypothetical protein PLD88_14520 [Candidatus Berkiella sp.]|nr:hypothetical protein [Candidatus Berkiella sp.]
MLGSAHLSIAKQILNDNSLITKLDEQDLFLLSSQSHYATQCIINAPSLSEKIEQHFKDNLNDCVLLVKNLQTVALTFSHPTQRKLRRTEIENLIDTTLSSPSNVQMVSQYQLRSRIKQFRLNEPASCKQQVDSSRKRRHSP